MKFNLCVKWNVIEKFVLVNSKLWYVYDKLSFCYFIFGNLGFILTLNMLLIIQYHRNSLSLLVVMEIHGQSSKSKDSGAKQSNYESSMAIY